MWRAAARQVRNVVLTAVYRPGELLERHLGHRGAVLVRVRDQVEGDVDASGLCRHGVDMLIDRHLVQCVDFGRLGHPTGEADLLGDLLERRPGAASEEDLRPLAGEGPGDRAADRAAASVDHGVLLLEQHVDTSLLGSLC